MTGTHMLVDGGLTIGQRHAWDPEAPGLFDALIAMEDAAKAGAAACPRRRRRSLRPRLRCRSASKCITAWAASPMA